LNVTTSKAKWPDERPFPGHDIGDVIHKSPGGPAKCQNQKYHAGFDYSIEKSGSRLTKVL
jgi:hypothetical protein